MAEFIVTTEQLDRLIASKVDEVTRDLQGRLAKTEKNRDSILREKRDLQRRINGEEPEGDALPHIVIPRGVSPKEYQRLKSEAEEQGLPYQVESTTPVDPTKPTRSKVKFVESDSQFFANACLLEQVGLPVLQLMAQNREKRLTLFRSAEELPDAAQATHDQILEANDHETLIEQGDQP